MLNQSAYRINSREGLLRSRLLSRTALSGLPLLLGIALLPGMALALPQDGVVAAGSAAIAQTGAASMTITQASQAAVIDWQSFNIGAGEMVEVFQPSAMATLLNRVVGGGGASNILGQLSANGQLTLVNPAGITIGHGARIDVAGLIASTANISNANFMGGVHSYATPGMQGARLSNAGEITAADGGLVALVGPSVENSGLITARLGKIAIAGGAERFTLDLYGDDLIHIGVDDAVMGAIAADALVANPGRISADGGVIQITARAGASAVENVINMSGVVQARSAGMENGEVVFYGHDQGIVQVSGTIDTSGKGAGQSGGNIKVLGDKVALTGNASLDASGDAGGGDILVGGAFQGGGDTPTASRTFVGRNASINSSAISTGNAGTAIVWADGDTRYYGSITARGGALSGDGGTVEVSGRQNLGFDGAVDTSAPNGNSGSLLLDPDRIVVENGAGPSLDDTGITGDGRILFDDPDGPLGLTFFISEGALEGLTTADLTLQAYLSVTINDLADNALNLTGISEGISFATFAGGEGFFMNAGDTILLDVFFTIDAPDGAIELGSLSSSDGVHLTAETILFGGASTMASLDASATNGITVNANLTSTLASPGANTGIILDGDSATDAFSGGITFASGVTLTSANVLRLAADPAATSGVVGASDLWALGALTLIANNFGDTFDSVELVDTLHAAGNLSINADSGADGVGDFFLASGNSLLLGGLSNSISSNDFILDGSITNAGGTVTLTHSFASSLAVGGVTEGDEISAAELSRITASTLRIFNSGATILVGPVAAADSDGFTTLLLFGNQITFGGGGSTFNALGVFAVNDIFIDADLTATGAGMTLDTDTNDDDSGDLVVGNEVTVSAPAGGFTITAADVDLGSTGALIAGGTGINLAQSIGGSIGLGGTPGALHLTTSELSRISTVTGASIGTAGVGTITVDGVTGVGALKGVLLQANQITFQNNPSTLFGFTANAENGIAVNVNISTTTNGILLDGDVSDNSSGGLSIASGVTITAAGLGMTLRADSAFTSGVFGASDIHAAGAVTLTALTGGVFVDEVFRGGGNVSINAGNFIRFTQAAFITGGVDIDSGDGVLTPGTGENVFFDSTATIGGGAIFSAFTGVGFGGLLSVGGALDVTAESQSIFFGGGATIGGAATLNAAGGITLVDDFSANGPVTLLADTNENGLGGFSLLGGGVLNSNGFGIFVTSSGVSLNIVSTPFSNDFEFTLPTGVSGAGTLQATQNFDASTAEFAGQFLLNDSAGNPAAATVLSLSDLPAHDSLSLSVLLALIDGWDGVDGGDLFNVTVDGVSVFSASFDNFGGAQSYVDSAALFSGINAGFGAAPDSAYHLRLIDIPHTAATAEIRFFASGPGWTGGATESFAIDFMGISTLTNTLSPGIGGFINTGESNATFNASTERDIGLGGVATQAMASHLSNAELSRISASQTNFSTLGNIIVDGVSGVDAMGNVDLNSTNGMITFQGAASAFADLNADAVEGIFVNTDLSATGDDLILDGDTSDESGGGITFADGVTLTAVDDLELYAEDFSSSLTPGLSDIWAEGALTLISTSGNGDVRIRDVLHAVGPVIISAADEIEFNSNVLISGNLTATAGTNDASGGVEFNGVTQIGGDLIIDAAEDVLFEIDLSVMGNLDITAGSLVEFIGETNVGGSLMARTDDIIEFNNDVLVSGAVELSGSEIFFDAAFGAGSLMAISSGEIEFDAESDTRVTGAVELEAVFNIIIDGAFQAGSLSAEVSGSEGSIEIEVNLGAVTPFAFVDLTADTVSIHDVSTIKTGITPTTNGHQTYGDGVVIFNSTYTTGGGPFTVTGAVMALSPTRIISGGGGILISGAVTGAGGVTYDSGGGPLVVSGVDLGGPSTTLGGPSTTLGGPSATVEEDVTSASSQIDDLGQLDVFADDQQQIEEDDSEEEEDTAGNEDGEDNGEDADGAAEDPYLRVVEEEDLGETNDAQDDEGAAPSCACGA